MLRRALVVVVTGVGMAACTPTGTSSVSSGTMALSADSANLYVIEADQNQVYVFDADTYAQLATVPVGKAPARITVASDETIYVSNRGERSVSVIARSYGSWAEAARIPVGVEPVGLAVTKDAKTLLVVNSAMTTDTDNGSLMAIDTASRQVIWETPVGHEPRAVGILADGTALVPMYFDGYAARVNVKTGAVVRSRDSLLNNDTIDTNPSAGAALGSPLSSGYTPTSLSDVAVTPDGQRAFIPGQWARIAPIQRPPSSGGYYSLGGPCGYGAVVAAGLITIDTNANSAKSSIDDLSSCSSSAGINGDPNAARPPSAIPSVLTTGTAVGVATNAANSKEVAGPVTAIVDNSGKYVYVAAQQSGNVVAMTAYSSANQPVNFGSGVVAYGDLNGGDGALAAGIGTTPGPSGLALHKDNRRLFVHNALDHTFAILTCDNCAATGSFTVQQTISYTKPTLPPDAEQGRRFFYTANNADLTAGGSPVACASCHLEGRTDGHPWGFPKGLSVTPVLVGRNFTNTLPWHWDGSFTDQETFFVHTITQRMGGDDAQGVPVHNQIVSWLDQYALVQDNPFKQDAKGTSLAPSASALRGQALFTTADANQYWPIGSATPNPNFNRACGSCHNPATSFALQANSIPAVIASSASYSSATPTVVNVGTVGSVSDPTSYTIEGQTLAEERPGFDVPSLLSVGRSGPYMHDARYPTLDSRLHDDNVAHGNPARFTEQQKQDLKAYLLTL